MTLRGRGITRRAAAGWLLVAAQLRARAAQACAPRLRVAATTPELASLAGPVGGELVQVRTLVPPGMDPESFEPGVRDLALLEGASVVLRVGLGFDFWLDPLLARTRRSHPRGQEEVVDLSAGIPLLEVHGRDPFARDGHGHGIANPHYWLDPTNAVTVTGTIAAALARCCPPAREQILQNRERFVAQLGGRMAQWRRRLAPCRGAAVLAYHDSWPYFARRFHLNVVGFVEPKEGVTPSAAHLANLLSLARRTGVRAILQTSSEPRKLSDALAERLGIPVVSLAPGVGSVAGTGDYPGFMEHNVEALARALGSAG